ncbi:MAG TPA: hypothetical protein VH589_22990 [Trebonia sp.]
MLPPAWRKIPVRDGTDKAIREIVDEVFAELPKNVPRDRVTPYRIELGRQLADAARQARRNGGTELYLPVQLQRGTLITASFVVSEGPADAAEGPVGVDPVQVAELLAARSEGGSPVTVDGAIGARTERTAPPDESSGAIHGSRHVDYVLSVPGKASRWLVIAFSALSAGDPDDKFAKLLVELFDAMMATFRWTRG